MTAVALPVRRPALLEAAAVIVGLAALGRLAVWSQIQAPVDWGIYRDAALRWQASGAYFLPEQLAGPYTLGHGEVLYPPLFLWLLVPFAHLPDILWWAVPIGITAAVLVRWRPAPWAWLAIAACLATPHVQGIILTGRPTMWIVAFMALGLDRGGWGALVLLKPSLFPFALVGVRRRWWWATLAAMAVLALPFGLLWLDWVRAMAYSNGGLLYSLLDVVPLLIPIAGYVGREDA